MVKEGGVQELGRYHYHVVSGGGTANRGGDKICPKRGKFYHHGRMEKVVRSGG